MIRKVKGMGGKALNCQWCGDPTTESQPFICDGCVACETCGHTRKQHNTKCEACQCSGFVDEEDAIGDVGPFCGSCGASIDPDCISETEDVDIAKRNAEGSYICVGCAY